MMVFLAAALFAGMLALTILSCVSDARRMRIPNWHSGVIVALFVPVFLLAPQVFGPWWHHLGGFALIAAATLVLYFTGNFGSGDTKLASALALWIGLKGLIPYLFYMSLTGGILAALTIAMQRKKIFASPLKDSWFARAQTGQSVVPYGIAISLGAWGALFHTGIFHRVIDEVSKIIH